MSRRNHALHVQSAGDPICGNIDEWFFDPGASNDVDVSKPAFFMPYDQKWCMVVLRDDWDGGLQCPGLCLSRFFRERDDVSGCRIAERHEPCQK